MLGVSIMFWTALNICVQIGVRFLPKWILNPYRPVFKERLFEHRLYKFLGVSRWKDKLPELGATVGFSKRQLRRPDSPKYLSRFIRETCIAELGHFATAVVGFSYILFVWIWSAALGFFVFVSILDFFVQMLFVIIQRYNRPRLRRLESMVAVRCEGTAESAESAEDEQSAVAVRT